jgi:hypothetical protein
MKYVWRLEELENGVGSHTTTCLRISHRFVCWEKWINFPCSTHLILLDLIIVIIFDEDLQIMKLLVVHFSVVSCYFVSVRSKYFPNTLFSDTHDTCCSLNMRKFHTHIKQATFWFVYFKLYVFRNRRYSMFSGNKDVLKLICRNYITDAFRQLIVWRARCGRSRRRCFSTHTHATMAAATMGELQFSLWSGPAQQ